MSTDLGIGTGTERTRRVVTDYAAALGRGDVAALRALFAPDATWILAGELPASGRYVGADAILTDFLPRVVGRLDPRAPVTQDVHRILADGEVGVAEWTSVATTRDGREYRNRNCLVFVVRDGLVAEVREYTDTDRMRRLLFTE